MKVVLASKNQHKLVEMRDILSAQGVERLTIPKIFSRLLEEMLMAG